jgi:hypothetical protein
MSDMKQGHRLQGRPDGNSVQQDHRPYWKRAHRDWRIWFAVFLMVTGMIIYVMSDDFALRPRSQPQQPRSGAVGK